MSLVQSPTPTLEAAATPQQEGDSLRGAQGEPSGGARLPLPAGVNLRRVHWHYAISFVVLHAAALLVFVPYFFSWVGALAFYFGVNIFGQLGVPIGYHRLLTHRSFKTPKWVERSLAVLAMCSAQETPARWVAWHRLHHKESDHREDPHSPLVTFLWGHLNWLVYENRSTNNFSHYQRYARDILEDPFYMWLEKIRYPMLYFYLGHAVLYFLASLGVCAACYGGLTPEAWRVTWSLFVWGVVLRTVYVWHITWAVNSLSHMFGYRNYDTSDASRNNWFVALITGGEGWHNNHHADQAAATVRHRWWEWDMNYQIIKTMEFFGLAWDIVPPVHVRRAARRAPEAS